MTQPKTLPPLPVGLLVFLSVATFFGATTLWPSRRSCRTSRETSGSTHRTSAGSLGLSALVVAYFLVRKADVRADGVLMLTILGYTGFSFLTAFAPNVWIFGAPAAHNMFLIGSGRSVCLCCRYPQTAAER